MPLATAHHFRAFVLSRVFLQSDNRRNLIHKTLLAAVTGGSLTFSGCAGDFQAFGIRGIMNDKARSFNDILAANIPTVSTDSLNGTWIAAVSSELQVTLVAIDTASGVQLLESDPIAGLEAMGIEDALEVNSSFKMVQSPEDPTLYNMAKCGVPNNNSAFRAVQSQNTLMSQLNEAAVMNPNTAPEGVNVDLPTLSSFIAYKVPGQIELNKKVVFDDVAFERSLFIGTLDNVNASLFPNNQIIPTLQTEINRFKAALPNNPNAILNLRFNNKAKMAWLKVLDDTQTALGTATVNGTAFNVDCYHFSKRTSGMNNLAGSATQLSHLQYHAADAAGTTFINIEEEDKPSADQPGILVSTTDLIHQLPANGNNRSAIDAICLGKDFINNHGDINGLSMILNDPENSLPAFFQEVPFAHINQDFCVDLIMADADTGASPVAANQFDLLNNKSSGTGIDKERELSNILLNFGNQLNDADRTGVLDKIEGILDAIFGDGCGVPVEQTLFSTTDNTLAVDTFNMSLQTHTVRFRTTMNAVEAAGTIDIAF